MCWISSIELCDRLKVIWDRGFFFFLIVKCNLLLAKNFLINNNQQCMFYGTICNWYFSSVLIFFPLEKLLAKQTLENAWNTFWEKRVVVWQNLALSISFFCFVFFWPSKITVITNEVSSYTCAIFVIPFRLSDFTLFFEPFIASLSFWGEKCVSWLWTGHKCSDLRVLSLQVRWVRSVLSFEIVVWVNYFPEGSRALHSCSPRPHCRCQARFEYLLLALPVTSLVLQQYLLHDL